MLASLLRTYFFGNSFLLSAAGLGVSWTRLPVSIIKTQCFHFRHKNTGLLIIVNVLLEDKELNVFFQFPLLSPTSKMLAIT